MCKCVLDTVRNKIWARIKYQCGTVNCSTCKHSSNWSDTGIGKCNVLVALLFDIFKHGICKYHSDFNGGNLRRK